LCSKKIIGNDNNKLNEIVFCIQFYRKVIT